MRAFARATPGGEPRFVSVDRPFSNFNFIDKEYKDWFWPLRRIMSQGRHHRCKTMVIEPISPCLDLQEENDDVRLRDPGFVRSSVQRIAFFSRAFTTRQGLRFAKDKEFIGYAIVKQDVLPTLGRKVTRIYESVIRPSTHPNSFVRGAQTWTCRVGAREFTVTGYLYAQQNNLTNVCAHVALRTAAGRFHRDGDMTYREMNQLLGIDHVSTKLGGGVGLDNDQMVRVLEAAGARCFVGDYTSPHAGAPPFHKYIYGSIESGYPAIVCFGTTRNAYHAIPVFGHTFNEDAWVSHAERSYFRVGAGTMYIPSDSWLDTYLAHDDNWGSNFCVPRHFLYPQRTASAGSAGSGPKQPPADGVAYIIGTMPKKVQVTPLRAEVIGADFLVTILPQLPPSSGVWAGRLRGYAKANLLVVRPILLDSAQYAQHLQRVKDWDGNPVRPYLLPPIRNIVSGERVWMIELSVPELFSANCRKVAEVLIRAEVQPTPVRDFNNFLLARVPGSFALFTKGSPANPQYTFVPSGLQSHVELFGCEGRP